MPRSFSVERLQHKGHIRPQRDVCISRAAKDGFVAPFPRGTQRLVSAAGGSEVSLPLRPPMQVSMGAFVIF